MDREKKIREILNNTMCQMCGQDNCERDFDCDKYSEARIELLTIVPKPLDEDTVRIELLDTLPREGTFTEKGRALIAYRLARKICDTFGRRKIDEGKLVYCVIGEQVKWTKPEGCGFIYRNLRGVYNDIEKARLLVNRIALFLGGDWIEQTNHTWIRNNDKMSIIELNSSWERQIFDWNH